MKRIILLISILFLLSGQGWAALPATDNFNRVSLGTNWTTLTSHKAITIDGSAQYAVGTVDLDVNAAYWNADSFANDQYAQIKFVGDISVGASVRCSGGNCYVGYIQNATTLKINKDTGGTFATLGADFTITSLVSGDIVKITATGGATTTLEIFVNGSSIGTRTDSSSPFTTGSAGIWTYRNSSLFDDFEGGNLLTANVFFTTYLKNKILDHILKVAP